MSLFSPKTISGKLTRINLLVSGVVLLLAFLSFLAYDLYSLRQSLINSLNTEAEIIGENSVTALLFDDPDAAQNTLSALRGSPHILSALIVRPNGEVFARYARNKEAPTITTLKPGGDDSDGYWSQSAGLLVRHSIVFQGKPAGSVYLLAATRDIAQRAKQFGLISAFILLLCFLGAIFATSSIRHLVTDPLSDLAATAKMVTRDQDYSVRAPLTQSEDELAVLMRAFNDMLQQIQDRDRALQESRSVLERRVQERTAELTVANKELEAFSYSVAHDLRGPLQQITNISYLLQNSFERGDSGDGSKLVDKIFEGSGRMSQLIDDLLNLSRATSTPLNRQAIDLSEMARSIGVTLAAESKDRHVEFVVADGAHVIGDEGLMCLVMENLLRNAWKYTSKKENARIEFGFRDESQGTVFFVRDNGVGFNPQYIDRLFRPFQRLHSQSEFVGTGVGLATVQRILARHGGKIWAQGVVGNGATFSFTVPYEKPA